ncbi:amidase [Pseudomonas sp. o96-267]|uniref:amidase n=1 Tax=Pseudomonas sp. o96-267 TaxID=2479853 RepID=UPI000F77BF00|nr:amidase [Pseudomonas sp. o96-267]RRV31612.1 amidase [Pseudomonas sp. o96-267]
MIRRHPILSVLALLLVLLLAWAWPNRVYLQAFPDIIGAYTAKEYCSCRYVSGNPAAYCEGYVALYVPISSLLDDESAKRVTASGLGRTHSAAWLGERQGCQLLPNE